MITEHQVSLSSFFSITVFDNNNNNNNNIEKQNNSGMEYLKNREEQIFTSDEEMIYKALINYDENDLIYLTSPVNTSSD